jgi:hypothetical protein
MLPLLAIALLGATSTVALAMPSLGGPTGLVTLPTASIAPVGEWQSAVTLRTFESSGMYTDLEATEYAFQFLKGISDDAEVWAGYSNISATGDADGYALQLGGKWQISSDLFGSTYSTNLANTHLALGGSIGTWTKAFTMYRAVGDISDVDLFKAYLVLTKQIYPAELGGWDWDPQVQTRLLGTFGLLYEYLDPDKGGTENLFEPFIGLEIIGPGGTLRGLVEYRPDDGTVDAGDVWSVAVRATLREFIQLEAGVTNTDPIGLGTDDTEFYVRLGCDVPVDSVLF